VGKMKKHTTTEKRESSCCCQEGKKRTNRLFRGSLGEDTGSEGERVGKFERVYGIGKSRPV